MDGKRFDELARSAASERSTRRGFFRTAAALIAAAAGSGAAVDGAGASRCRSAGQVCTEGGHCCSGACLPKDRTGRRRCAKTLGEACAAAAECASGFCVDGVCCDGACGGQCESCRTGTCTAVTGAPIGRAACAGSGACGGACDGVNRAACGYPGPATSCGAPDCSEGDARTFACDGVGSCAASTTDCGLYACVAGSCAASCASDDDCIGAAYCANGVCAGDQPDGAPCTRAGECLSGACVEGTCVTPLANGAPSTNPARCASGIVADGVCCDRACAGQCEACNLSGSTGTCSPVSGAAVGNRPPCAGGCVDGTCPTPGCQSEADCPKVNCEQQVCVNGTCQPPLISTKPFSVCFDYVCNQSTQAWERGAATVCDSPGPCQTTVGATCVEENLRGCVYPSTCALCETCQDGVCVSDCPDVGCYVNGVCNKNTGFCDFDDGCPVCQRCQLGTCLAQPNGTETLGDDDVTRTCCFGEPNRDCGLGICPVNGVCCRRGEEYLDGLCCPRGNVNIGGQCCPGGSVDVCYEAILGDGICCTRPCVLQPASAATFCPD